MSTEQDNVNAGAIGTLVAVLTLATLGVALGVTALVRAEATKDEASKYPTGDHIEIEKRQNEALSAPAAWVEKDKGHVSIPVSHAMELTAKDLKENPESATPPGPPVPVSDAGADGDADLDGGALDSDGAALTDDASADGEAAPNPEVPPPGAPPVNPAPPAPKPPPPAPEPPPPAPEETP